MTLLRRALVADATLTALSAPTFLLLAPQTAALTGLPVGLLRGAGVFLVAWCGWFLLVLRDEPPRRGLVAVVLLVNTLWVAGSIAVAAGLAGEPTAAGVAFALTQAVAVAALTVAQVAGLRTGRRRAALPEEDGPPSRTGAARVSR